VLPTEIRPGLIKPYKTASIVVHVLDQLEFISSKLLITRSLSDLTLHNSSQAVGRHRAVRGEKVVLPVLRTCRSYI
jgi:hypothetical protein